MQYTNNCTQQEDEETQTMLEALANVNFIAKTAEVLEVTPSPQYFVMMTQKEREHDAMADGCANSHIGNLNDWLPLTLLEGPLVKFHENLSAKLQKMGFVPSKADFDLWVRDMGIHHK